MVIASIRPSTVDGIKQLAKKIRRERSITHTEALDEAGRQAGYENFLHAKRQLAGAFPGTFPIYLSVHWQAARRRGGEPAPVGPRAGREILRLELTRPLAQIVAKHRVSRARGLHGFREEYADHLEHLTDVQGQDAARRTLLTAARALRFMEATGLQPVTTQKHRDILRELDRLPGRDHVSQWFDPVTDGCILLDEPYTTTLSHYATDRKAWLERRNLQSLAVQWEGIYLPGECAPLLVGNDWDLLQRVAEALATAKPVEVQDPWPYETGQYGDDYVSPQRLADEKPRRRRPGASWRDHKGATPYGGAPGIPSRWRPIKSMPIELHKQLGPLIQKLCDGFSWRVSQKLGSARSQLEEWVINEHKHNHAEVVYDLYYGGPSGPIFTTDAERLEGLTLARSIVERGYDDCKPRRELLAALDAALAEVGSRGTTSAG